MWSSITKSPQVSRFLNWFWSECGLSFGFSQSTFLVDHLHTPFNRHQGDRTLRLSAWLLLSIRRLLLVFAELAGSVSTKNAADSLGGFVRNSTRINPELVVAFQALIHQIRYFLLQLLSLDDGVSILRRCLRFIKILKNTHIRTRLLNNKMKIVVFKVMHRMYPANQYMLTFFFL